MLAGGANNKRQFVSLEALEYNKRNKLKRDIVVSPPFNVIDIIHTLSKEGLATS